MTAAEIEKLKAGRELDEAVAEYVMGLTPMALENSERLAKKGTTNVRTDR